MYANLLMVKSEEWVKSGELLQNWYIYLCCHQIFWVTNQLFLNKFV